MDIVVALLPSILYGSQQLLMGAYPAGPRRQNVAVLVGAGIISLLAASVVGGAWSGRALLWGVLSGVLWSGGQVYILRGFQSWGVSRTMPFIASGQITLNALVGVLLLGEWRAPGALPLGLTALAAIMGGAAACAYQERGGAGPTPAQRRAGILASLACSVLYGLYPGMLRLAGVSSRDALGPMGIGLLLGALGVAVVLRRADSAPVLGPGSFPGAAAGALWAVGNAILLHSTATVGVATSLALSQLSFVLSTFGGILLLGETKTRREWWVTVPGVALAVLGVLLLGLAAAR